MKQEQVHGGSYRTIWTRRRSCPLHTNNNSSDLMMHMEQEKGERPRG
jgi:hypothetical protein